MTLDLTASTPLDREHMTAASRIMLPVYARFATVVGLIYLFDPQGRLQRSPTLAFARVLLPMWAWGLLFLTVAVVMGVALRTRDRELFIKALYLYMVVAVVWAGIFLGSCFVSDAASFTGPAWPLFVAYAARASARSLKLREA